MDLNLQPAKIIENMYFWQRQVLCTLDYFVIRFLPFFRVAFRPLDGDGIYKTKTLTNVHMNCSVVTLM